MYNYFPLSLSGQNRKFSRVSRKKETALQDNTNEKDLTSDSSEVWLEESPGVAIANITTCKRIGIDGSGAEYANLPYRFYEKNNENVSVLDQQDKKGRKRKATDHH